MAQRQDRDTFGVHQNRVLQNAKKNSFSASWDVQSTMTQDTNEDAINWSKVGLEMDKLDGRRRDSWDLGETVTNNTIEPRHLAESWDREEIKFEKHGNKKPKPAVRETNNDSVDRPTFKSHMFSKNAHEREKKLSVASTQMTDKTDRNESKYQIIFPRSSLYPSLVRFFCLILHIIRINESN